MGDTEEKPPGRRPLSLNPSGVETVRQTFSHGRSKQVVVEKKKKRSILPQAKSPKGNAKTEPDPDQTVKPVIGPQKTTSASRSQNRDLKAGLREEEVKARQEALSRRKSEEGGRRKAQAESEALAQQRREEELRRLEEEKERAEQKARTERADAEEKERRRQQQPPQSPPSPAETTKTDASSRRSPQPPVEEPIPDDVPARGGRKARSDGGAEARPSSRPRGEPKRRQGKLTIAAALGDYEERQRSLASVKRARERERERRSRKNTEQTRERVTREVVVPESITVRDLASRMSERAAQIIRYMMNQGEMMRAEDVLDADTAELIVREFGHVVRRVAESDVEIGIDGPEDDDADLTLRPPVVTVMGHVDHGKTSLLDAMRRTDTVSGESGGITQHIGAYRVRSASGVEITFIDTPGHAAFSAMRARGASATDIVILVVAADDGVMPQTVEAIDHARAAGVPLIVAVNKMDVEGADPERIYTDLLQHRVHVEAMGGDVQSVEISAMTGDNLDALTEAIALQAEVMELRANPDRDSSGVVIESRLDRGRGPVATLLVQRGTLHRGDIVVAGAQWGKARALLDEHGQTVKGALPGTPMEILGLEAAPDPGEQFFVVESEARAREITEFRSRKQRETGSMARASLEQIKARLGQDTASSGTPIEVSFVIKGDVQGSVEAIRQAVETISSDDLKTRVVHGGVGGISEGDVLLASTCDAHVVAFNVRGSSQALSLAERQNVEIRYYSVIYDLIDDIRAMLSGMLTPEQRETFIGYASVLEIFGVSKVGRVAGCMVTEGLVRRGCGVRLLRDDIVIHQGEISTLKRFREEVSEVADGNECGMAFKDFKDMRPGDRVECFTTREVARTLN